MTGITITTDCCVVGGGTAGMMLAVLLARAGVETVVLEKHADFLRDFRGDTIHPSTLEILAELGWIADFLRLPLREIRDVGVDVSGVHIPVADFSHLPVRCLFVVLMPQQGFLARQGAAIRLRRRLEAPGLIMDEGRIAGVQAQEPDHTATVRAKLVVHTTIRSGRRNLVAYEVVAMVRKGQPRKVDGCDIPAQAAFIARMFQVAALLVCYPHLLPPVISSITQPLYESFPGARPGHRCARHLISTSNVAMIPRIP